MLNLKKIAHGLTAVLIGAMTMVPLGLIDAQSYTQNGGTATKTNENFTGASTDESGVLVKNSGTLTMTNCTVTTSGNTSSSDNSSFYGLNAGVLASSSKITMTGGTVTTTGSGANGVFAYGSSGSVVISDVTVKCTGQYAHAVMASGGGSLTVTNVNMSTAGTNSGAIATDRGGGTLIVTGGTVTTSGKDSPGIYSTGTITVADATITATGAEGAVIEGLNTVNLTNVNLKGGAQTYGGALIVQSMSGDASTGTSTFIMNNGSFTATQGPLFFVTNNSADIKLTGVSLSVASGTLIDAAGTSRWGTTGKNGGLVTFVADRQTLNGNIVIDSYSTFNGTLKDTSVLTGAINNANTASSAALTMDATSSWTLTGDSYLASLSNSAGISGTTVANITGNGHNVYYNSSLSANSYLGGSSYTLVNGGKLTPGTTTDVKGISTLPTNWNLNQNYPNPFNPSTVIGYQVPKTGQVGLRVFDILGREVAVLVNGSQQAGSYSVSFNAKNLPSGTYVYRISGDNFSMAKKMLLVK